MNESVLLAEDDPDDIYLVKEASKVAKFSKEIRTVKNGQELLKYLNREYPFSDVDAFPFPSLIILDLNMPLLDGRETLKKIKSDSRFNHIPVVVLTTSADEEDIVRSYDNGANSFITKPGEFIAFVKLMEQINKYWFDTVHLPYGDSLPN